MASVRGKKPPSFRWDVPVLVSEALSIINHCQPHMQHKPNTKLRDLLKSKIAKTCELSELSKAEQNKLAKLNTMLDELRRGKNVQNRRLASWLSADEYEQIAAEWNTQKHFRKELKEQPVQQPSKPTADDTVRTAIKPISPQKPLSNQQIS